MPQLSRTLSEDFECVILCFNIIYCSFQVYSICEYASLSSVIARDEILHSSSEGLPFVLFPLPHLEINYVPFKSYYLFDSISQTAVYLLRPKMPKPHSSGCPVSQWQLWIIRFQTRRYLLNLQNF